MVLLILCPIDGKLLCDLFLPGIKMDLIDRQAGIDLVLKGKPGEPVRGRHIDWNRLGYCVKEGFVCIGQGIFLYLLLIVIRDRLFRRRDLSRMVRVPDRDFRPDGLRILAGCLCLLFS